MSAKIDFDNIQPNSLLKSIFRLTPPQEAGLKKLGIITVRELLYHLPTRHEEEIPLKAISDIAVGEKVTVAGTITKTKITRAYRKKIPIAEVTIKDHSGSIKAVWYHQAYMAKKVPEGHSVRLSGVVTARKDQIYIANPLMEAYSGSLGAQKPLIENEAIPQVPVYPESAGISSLWIYAAVQKCFQHKLHEKIADPLPIEMLKKYSLPPLSQAILLAHSPRDARDSIVARKRFAFEEIFFIQLSRLEMKRLYQAHGAYSLAVTESSLNSFIKRFPFEPTNAQNNAIKEILSDLSRSEPMMRLLEGDVGSGKTFVAAAAAFATISNPPKDRKFGNLQVAYMAPTEILAKQHFESFIEYFKDSGIQVGLITGTECRKFPSKVDPSGHTHVSRAQLLKWLANGEIPILIGTHSLIQKTVRFKNLALVIIDEQHRFGTAQRGKLTKKDLVVPHLLTMSATPIPRTLALTIYGDLDLSILDEQPAGRKPIITEVVPPKERGRVYEAIKKSLVEGHQTYVICPRIDEPDPTKELAVLAKSAKAEAERLKREVFVDRAIGLLHSKLKPDDKEKVMQKFSKGEIDILVATSVVEVGVNVPNATTIIIEGAERFGLAQLHQLRGRVLRSSHQAYCYLFSDSSSDKTNDRLRALVTAKNGFELSEIDLKLRGAGALGGGKQWGITDIGMEAIQNLKLVEAARTEARSILEKDFELKNYPEIKQRLASQEKQFHLE